MHFFGVPYWQRYIVSAPDDQSRDVQMAQCSDFFSERTEEISAQNRKDCLRRTRYFLVESKLPEILIRQSVCVVDPDIFQIFTSNAIRSEGQ
jgi:hypothetical protein